MSNYSELSSESSELYISNKKVFTPKKEDFDGPYIEVSFKNLEEEPEKEFPRNLFVNGIPTAYYYLVHLPYLAKKNELLRQLNENNSNCKKLSDQEGEDKTNQGIEDNKKSENNKNKKVKKDNDDDKRSIAQTLISFHSTDLLILGRVKPLIMDDLFRYADKFHRKLATSKFALLQDFSNPIFVSLIHKFIFDLIKFEKNDEYEKKALSLAELIVKEIAASKLPRYSIKLKEGLRVMESTPLNEIIDLSIFSDIYNLLIKLKKVNLEKLKYDSEYFNNCENNDNKDTSEDDTEDEIFSKTKSEKVPLKDIYHSSENSSSLNNLLNIIVGDMIFIVKDKTTGKQVIIPVPIYNASKKAVFSEYKSNELKKLRDVIKNEIDNVYSDNSNNKLENTKQKGTILENPNLNLENKSYDTKSNNNREKENLLKLLNDNYTIDSKFITHSEHALYRYLLDPENCDLIADRLGRLISILGLSNINLELGHIIIFMYSTRQICSNCMLLMTNSWKEVLDIIKPKIDFDKSKNLIGIKKYVSFSLEYEKHYKDISLWDTPEKEMAEFMKFINEKNSFLYQLSKPIHWCSKDFIEGYFYDTCINEYPRSFFLSGSYDDKAKVDIANLAQNYIKKLNKPIENKSKLIGMYESYVPSHDMTNYEFLLENYKEICNEINNNSNNNDDIFYFTKYFRVFNPNLTDLESFITNNDADKFYSLIIVNVSDTKEAFLNTFDVKANNFYLDTLLLFYTENNEIALFTPSNLTLNKEDFAPLYKMNNFKLLTCFNDSVEASNMNYKHLLAYIIYLKDSNTGIDSIYDRISELKLKNDSKQRVTKNGLQSAMFQIRNKIKKVDDKEIKA